MTQNDTNNNKLTIRNSTAEFLIFTQQAGESGIEVRYEDGSIWLTQKLMAELFDVTTANVNTHIKNIYEEKELVQNLTIKEFLIVQKEGARQVARNVEYYNLDMIISLGGGQKLERMT